MYVSYNICVLILGNDFHTISVYIRPTETFLALSQKYRILITQAPKAILILEIMLFCFCFALGICFQDFKIIYGRHVR